MSKRGQVSIFVIVAVVLVGIVLVFYAIPQTRVFLPGSTAQDPNSFVEQCMLSDVEESLEKIMVQGGSYTPDNYLMYNGEQLQYLCYTTENYIPCTVQQPLLVSHVEQELKDAVQQRASSCVQQLEEEFERRGYSIAESPGELNVSIVPGMIFLSFDGPFVVQKETTETFRSVVITQESNAYDLLLIASSIVEFESTLGDSETTLYMNYYPDLVIEKMRREGDTIYTIRNVVTQDEFRFASRSLVWPAGYGTE